MLDATPRAYPCRGQIARKKLIRPWVRMMSSHGLKQWELPWITPWARKIPGNLLPSMYTYGQAPELPRRTPQWGPNRPTRPPLSSRVLVLDLIMAHRMLVTPDITMVAPWASSLVGIKHRVISPRRLPVPFIQTIPFLELQH